LGVPPGYERLALTFPNCLTYARELYVNLRTLDKSGAKEILVEEVPTGEQWDAIRDRLRRAASAENVVSADPDIAALRADLGQM